MTYFGQGSPVLGKDTTSEGTRHRALEPGVVQFWEKSKAGDFGITAQDFSTILRDIAKKSLPENKPEDVRAFYESLRLEELALARGCAAGNDHAWEVFTGRYREKLYDIAGFIAKESESARELADSLYTDLYGTKTRDGERISKLSSYTGRGSLEGWLRTVMAQEYVNRYRRQRRLVSLDEEREEGTQFAAPQAEHVETADLRMVAAVDEALSSLPAGDRFVLASYYLDQRTLAQIAKTLSVHESTISRKLDKLAKSLRKQILASLIARGMSRRQAEESLDVDVRDIEMNIRASLTQESKAGAFSKKKEKDINSAKS